MFWKCVCRNHVDIPASNVIGYIDTIKVVFYIKWNNVGKLIDFQYYFFTNILFIAFLFKKIAKKVDNYAINDKKSNIDIAFL